MSLCTRSLYAVYVCSSVSLAKDQGSYLAESAEDFREGALGAIVRPAAQSVEQRQESLQLRHHRGPAKSVTREKQGYDRD